MGKNKNEIDADDVKKNYKLELLNENHDLSKFKSKSKDLNDFLKNNALLDQSRNLNVTHLIIYKEEIIGFFSLANDAVPIKKLKKEEKEKFEEKTDYKDLPAMKIGRYALAENYTGKGLGGYFLLIIMVNIRNIARTKSGIRIITVDGYANAYGFYNKFEFKAFKSHENDVKTINKIAKTDPNKTIPMYQDIKETN